MLDIKFLRENPEIVKENIKKKFQDRKLELVDEVIELDKKNREIKQEVQQLQANRNKTSKMIGKLMGYDDNAEALVAGMQDTFAELKEASKGDGSESIYFEVSPLQWGLWTAGTGTFMDEITQMLGLKNAFSDVEGWGEISEEQVIERAPDYIVTITMYFGEGPTPEEEIMSRAGWEKIPAVANGRILNLQNNELSRPGPRLADGAKMLCEFIYGAEEEASDAAA